MAEKIVITLDADARGLQSALSDAEKGTKDLSGAARVAGKESAAAGDKGQRAWKRWGAAAQVAGKVAAGVLAGIVAAGGATIALAADIDDLAKSARALGTSADELNRVQLALEQGGVSAGSATSALQSLERQLGRASTQGGPLADIVSDLGLSFEQLEQAAPTEKLSLLIDRLSNVDDSSARAYASSQLFRGSSVELNRIIAEGSGAFDQYLDNLSGVSAITDETAAESEALTNAVSLLKAEGGALIREFFEPLIPAVIDFVNATRTGVAELKALLGIANEATGEVDALAARTDFAARAVARHAQITEELNERLAEYGADDAGVLALMDAQAEASRDVATKQEMLRATQERLGLATAETSAEVERYTIRTREAAQAGAEAVEISGKIKEGNDVEKQSWVELQAAISATRAAQKQEGIDALAKQQAIAAAEAAVWEEQAQLKKDIQDKTAADQAEHEAIVVSMFASTARAQMAIANGISQAIQDSARERGLSEKEAALEAFRVNKATGIINATIATALAVVQAIAQVPYPANIAAAAAAGVAGAIQVGVIASQKPPTFHLGKSFASDEAMALVRERERVLTPRGAEAIGGDAGVQAANAGMVSGMGNRPIVLAYRNDVFAEAQNDLSQSRGFAVQRSRPGTNRPAAYTSAR